MTRLTYNPSYVCLYLNKETDLFYRNNTFFLKYKNLYIETFQSKLSKLFPKIEFISNSNSLGFQEIQADSEVDFLFKIKEILPNSQSRNEDWDEVCILYFHGLAPLLDLDLTKKIWQRHTKFLSQYSYSENLPDGIIPRILTREFIETLPKSLSQTVHEFFLKNINNYDVEIFFEHPDLRQYRLKLTPNNARSHHLVKHILDKSPDFPYSNLINFIKENSNLYRSSPSWIELELIRGCELKCTFCPRQYSDNALDGSQFTINEVLDLKNKLSSLDSNYTICIGGMGEPLLHTDFEQIVKEIVSLQNLSELIVETSLSLHWNRLSNCIKSLNELEKKKLTIIINLTTLKEERYKAIYGQKLLKEVLTNVDSLTKILPIENVHVQILKILEVEDEVDSYFTFFEKKNINIIFQKYNSYAGSLEEKRVSDLTPLKREFCWHLARDLYIHANGDVAVCKQVVNDPKIRSLGNIKTQTFEDIWNKSQSIFQESILGNHHKTGLPCLQCDEWYTFNS
ncbi:MAG: spiro-SPASM protein [Leptospiraceae bacterium]|nr:spiro-SPASM protein [Leptospiraceae bacterium]MCZ8346582.1 spiro-SPASM protein [Leptospiraceae bacterium]